MTGVGATTTSSGSRQGLLSGSCEADLYGRDRAQSGHVTEPTDSLLGRR